MIRKFQQGGQQDAVMQFVKGLADTLQADPQQIIQIAQQNPDALKTAVQVYQETKDIKQAAQAFAQSVSKQTQSAKHGAKLRYIRSLKNQCAEGEELYYYKKGGQVGCGCVKKGEEGIQMPNKKDPVKKFKNRTQSNNESAKWTDKDEQKLDSLSSQKKLTPQGEQEKKRLQNKFKKAPNRKNYEIEEGKCGIKVEKDCGGSAIAKFKAKCGSKLKKH